MQKLMPANNYLKVFALTIFTMSLVLSNDAFAARKGGGAKSLKNGSVSIGLGVSLMSANQDGLNDMIKAAKVAQPGVTTSELSSAMEYNAQLTFTFSSGLVALQLRPSYFTQSSMGSGPSGDYDYKLTGFSFFPLVRIIPLSNDIIDFYIQGGLGYGELKGDVTNGTGNNVSFKGSGFGLQVGLGANFCMTASHCFGVEGNYRYLPISRNIVDSSSGTISGTTQIAPNKELEGADGNDVGTSMSGVGGTLSYVFNF